MFFPLPTASLRLAQLFADPHRFRIPIYQRPYSWTTTEAGQLLDDLMQAAGLDDGAEGEADYFLGSILLLQPEARSFEGEAGEPMLDLEIVDGQQRLLTLTILAGVLRDLEEDASGPLARKLDLMLQSRNDTASYRLRLPPADAAFFARYVQAPGACRMPLDDSGTEPQPSAAQEAVVKVRDLILGQLASVPDAQRAAFAQYLLENCHFVTIQTRDIDRAHRMFMVLNDRGQPLQRKDILKAEILRAVPEEFMAEAGRAWDEAEASLGSGLETFLSHLRLAYGHVRPQVIAGVRQVVRSSGGAQPFMLNVFQPMLEAYRAILSAPEDGSRLDPRLRRALISMSRLNGADWMPAALVAFVWHGKEPDVARRLLEEIERLGYLMRVLCLGSGKRQRRFGQVVEMLHRAGGDARALDYSVFDLSRDELRTAAYNLKDLYARNLQGCKLLLLRLNDELEGGPTPIDATKLTVEHILPQRPRAKSKWRESFPNSEERLQCTTSLGNLVLVSQTQNEKARNEEYERKREIYLAPRGRDRLLPITHEALAAATWGPGEVRQRERRLIAMLAALWRLEIDGI